MMDRNILKYLMLIFVVFFSINLPTLFKADFVADDILILNMSRLDTFPVLSNWTESLKEYQGINSKPNYFYRPVHSLLMYVNFKIAGYNAWVYNLISLLLLFSCFLVFWIVLYKLSKMNDKFSLRHSLLVSCIFLFYPPNIYNATWISGRVDLWLMFFLLLSLYFAIMYLLNGKSKYLLIGIAFYVLSLMTKDNAVLFIIPIIVILFVIYRSERNNHTNFIILVLTYLMLGILYIAFRFLIIKLYPSLEGGFATFESITLLLRSIIEPFILIDSGELINRLSGNEILFIPLIVYLLLLLIFFARYVASVKHRFFFLSAFLLIMMSTSVFYYFRGGLAFRFYSCSFTFVLIYVFTYTVLNIKQVNYKYFIRLNFIVVILSIIMSFNLLSNWWKSFDSEHDYLNNLTLYSSGKKTVLLNYPHSYNNTYSFSDISYAIKFNREREFGNDSLIVPGLATAYYSLSDYQNSEITVSRINDSLFCMNSLNKECYFYPFPFYTDDISLTGFFYLSNGVKCFPGVTSPSRLSFNKKKLISVFLQFPHELTNSRFLYYSNGEIREVLK